MSLLRKTNKIVIPSPIFKIHIFSWALQQIISHNDNANPITSPLLQSLLGGIPLGRLLDKGERQISTLNVLSVFLQYFIYFSILFLTIPLFSSNIIPTC